MLPDWLSNLLPALNAAGMPILAIAIVLLIKAYQKLSNTHKEIADHLREENGELRTRLLEANKWFFQDIQEVQGLARKGAEVIKELQARKIELLNSTSPARLADPNEVTSALRDTEAILAEVRKIDDSIETLNEVTAVQRKLEWQLQQYTIETKMHLQSLTGKIGELAQMISDVKSRVAIIGVIISDPERERLISDASDKKRGLTTDMDIEVLLARADQTSKRKDAAKKLKAAVRRLQEGRTSEGEAPEGKVAEGEIEAGKEDSK